MEGSKPLPPTGPNIASWLQSCPVKAISLVSLLRDARLVKLHSIEDSMDKGFMNTGFLLNNCNSSLERELAAPRCLSRSSAAVSARAVRSPQTLVYLGSSSPP